MMVADLISAMLLSLQPGPPPPAPTSAQQQPQPPRLVPPFRLGPHWTGSFLRSSTLEYSCPGHSVEIRLRHWVRNTEGGHGIVVEALRVDGRPVAAARLAELNVLLEESAVPPDIRPLCTRDRVALDLLSIERNITQSERFSLD